MHASPARIHSAAFAFLALAGLADRGIAQTITWGPVIPCFGAADVNTNGTLIVARNLHAAGTAQSPTVNGVSFLGGFAPSGWTNASTLALNGSTTGDAGYDVLLSGARATSATTGNPTGFGAIRIDNLAALTVGRTYEIQCWFTDQRPGSGAAAIYDRVMTLGSAVGAATLTGGEVNNLGSLVAGPLSGALDGDPDNFPALGGPDALFGSHCTGTFTRVNGTDQIWLLVQGSHPIPTNLLRSHLSAFQIRELPAPTWSAYGAGCAGPAGLTALQLVSPPAIGGTFALDALPIGSGIPVMLLGLTQTNTPLTIPPFVAGCVLLASPDLAMPMSVSGSVASWSLGIPATPALAGAQVFNQAIELGTVWSMSNGGVGTLR